MRLEQLGDGATMRCSSLAASGQRDTAMLQRIWADLERIQGPGCLVEVRRRSWWTEGAEAVVVIATFDSGESYTSMGLKLLQEQPIVLGRPLRQLCAHQATTPHDVGDCVRWRPESLCGHSKAANPNPNPNPNP